MVVYAKSNPIEFLEEHTEHVVNSFSLIRDLYGNHIDSLIPSSLRDYFWDAGFLCCSAHDLGKVNAFFQNDILSQIKKAELEELGEKSESNSQGNTLLLELKEQISKLKIQKKVLASQGLTNIPHNILSPAFIESNVRCFPDEIQSAIYQAIAFHHARGEEFWKFDFEWQKVDKLIKDDLSTKLSELSVVQKYFAKPLDSPSSRFGWRLRERFPDDDVKKFYIFLKGLLHRADHSGSAYSTGVVSEIPAKIDRSKSVTEYLSKKTSKIWQKDLALTVVDQNVIFEASTGSGKTEFALYWADDAKAFYTLPVRTSVNSMYERINHTYVDEKVGLLHSDAILFLVDEEQSKNKSSDTPLSSGIKTALQTVDMARQLSMPFVVSTVDQLFVSVFHPPAYEKTYATLAYSKVIIDEIQSYDPEILAVIVTGLRDVVSLGGKFCLITATLPPICRDYLEKNVADIKILPPKLSPLKKHRVYLLEKSISEIESVEKIVQCYCRMGDADADRRAILVVVNTIRRAQELYDILATKAKDKGIEEHEIRMLHSNFIHKDRSQLELILTDKEKPARGIWICTQLVEVSLDIDFPILFTEMSTMDSLIQRMGRINRNSQSDYQKGEPNVFVFTEASGISSIYDKDLFTISLQELKDMGMSSDSGRLISQAEEHDLLLKVYSSKNFTECNYYYKYKKALALIESGLTAETKTEAQRLFRKILNLESIPVDIYNNNLKEIHSCMKTLLSKNVKREEKISALLTIKGFVMPTPFYNLLNRSVTRINERYDIYVIDAGYDPKRGLFGDPASTIGLV